MNAVPETFAPRPYQADAIKALTAGWQGANNRLAVVLPTGAGKTVVFSNLVLEALTALNGRRVLVIAHREELITQAADKIKAVCPQLRVGIVKAEKDEHRDYDVIVASIQTLAGKRRREAVRDIGMIIVDECHHAAARTYMTVLEHFGAWRGVPTAGFTATMTRTDGGLADVWQEVVYTLDILEMISDGYLVNVRGKRVVVEGLNLDKVKTRGGDLADGQLGQAMEDSGAAEVVADAYGKFAADRPGLVFTPTVATAQLMADAFNDAGITAATIWGDMPRDARTTALEWYRTGKVQVLTNCMVLTEGFDAPHTSCVVIARPTKSPGLYCQMAGRGLRLSPETGKKDALILDVMGASTRHRLASIIDLAGRKLPEPKDDQSLTDLAAEADAAERAAPAGEVEWEDIDLFNNSAVLWLRTYSGTWFVPCGQYLLFLAPGRVKGHFRVRRWDAVNGTVSPSPDHERPLSASMVWAEAQSRRFASHVLVAKSASWRARPASAKQLKFCRARKILLPINATQGDASDARSIHEASLCLDQQKAMAA